MLAGAILGWSVIHYVLKDSTAIVAIKSGVGSNSSVQNDTTRVDSVSSSTYSQINKLGNIRP